MDSPTMSVEDATALAHRIGREVAAIHAADVDLQARFPKETIDAFRAEGLLGALVPTELGGLGHDLRTAAAVVRTVGRYCASSAMILAMHHIQVACLVRHGRSEELRGYARRVAADQLLLASATTEIGIGGNTRSSTCFVERDGADGFTLTKQAPVISYGEYADAIFTTARRDAESPPSDQVLAVCETPAVTLTPLSGWDTLGFRGTCSLGFTLEASGDAALILDDPFGDISAQTMLPTAHLLWSSLWLGLAEEASWRAQRFVQKAARKDPGTMPPGRHPAGRADGHPPGVRGDRRLPHDPLPVDHGRPRGDQRGRLHGRDQHAQDLGVHRGRRRGQPGDADLRHPGLPRGLRVLPRPHPARRPRGRGHGQQRPHRRQHRPAGADAARD